MLGSDLEPTGCGGEYEQLLSHSFRLYQGDMVMGRDEKFMGRDGKKETFARVEEGISTAGKQDFEYNLVEFCNHEF